MIITRSKHPRARAHVFIPTARRMILAASILTILLGVVLWKMLVPTDSLQTIPLHHTATSIAVDVRIGRAIVYGGAETTALSVLDTRTGALLRTVYLKNGSCRGVVVVERTGRAFVLMEGAQNNHAHAVVLMLDTRTGTLLHVAPLPADPAALAADDQAAHVFAASGGWPTGANNTLGPGTLSILDARTGTILRRVHIGIHPLSIAVDSRTRHVFVVNGGPIGPTGLSNSTVTMLNADTGHLLRTLSLGQDAEAIVADAPAGHLFVTSEGGHAVRMLDARTGTLLRTSRVGFPVDVAVDAPAGRVVVANGAPGTVSLIDAVSGAMLQTLYVGGDPAAVAVDAQSGRAFVTDTGTNPGLYQHLRAVPLLRGALPSDYGYLTVLDTRSGRILRIIHVGTSGAKGIAVDEQAKHLFIVNPTGNSVQMLDTTA